MPGQEEEPEESVQMGVLSVVMINHSIFDFAKANSRKIATPHSSNSQFLSGPLRLSRESSVGAFSIWDTVRP
jgi:hypothetical protein